MGIANHCKLSTNQKWIIIFAILGPFPSATSHPASARKRVSNQTPLHLSRCYRNLASQLGLALLVGMTSSSEQHVDSLPTPQTFRCAHAQVRCNSYKPPKLRPSCSYKPIAYWYTDVVCHRYAPSACIGALRLFLHIKFSISS